MADNRNFDQASIQKAGGWNLISATEFFAIPLAERIKLLLENKIQFIRDGKIIPVTEALKA